WARVVYSPEQQRFLVAYTKILGATSHQRTARFLSYNAGSPAFLTDEIPVATFRDAGNAAGVAYSPGAGVFLVSWYVWAPNPTPQSYVAALAPNGTIVTPSTLLTDPADGQSDPNIACNTTGRCLIVGYSWGNTNGGRNTIWGRFIDGAAAAVGANSFVVDSAAIEGDGAATFNPATGQFVVTFVRDFKTIWSKTVDVNGGLGSATLLKQSTNSAEDGGGFGLPSLAYNSTSQSFLLTMGSWWGKACALQLTSSGTPTGATDCVPGGFEATHYTVAVADPGRGRFAMFDNQAYAVIRATIYQVGSGAGGGGGGGTAPTITTQPLSPSIANGATATLTVAATGTTPLSYQWYLGTSPNTGSPIGGATAASYTTPALTSTTSYWVRVSNAIGTANSTTATVTVAPAGTAPTITTQPLSPSIANGATATLTVAATGTTPLSYQWYLGTSPSTASPIGGATAASYTTPALTSTTSYWVRVSNAIGTANSTTATVTVAPAGGGGGGGGAPPSGTLTRALGPTTVADDSRRLVRFDAAFDSINNVYLVVWGTQSSGPVNGQFVGQDGGPIGARFAISTGSQQAGWARVVYSPEQQRFLVAYTKVLGATSHQRTARFLSYNAGSPAFLTSEIPVATFRDPGNSAGIAYSPGAGVFLVTWHVWAPNPTPQSFVAALAPDGTIVTPSTLLTDTTDGQSDPHIACNTTGRCLVVGYSWGNNNGGRNTIWGRFVDGAAAAVGANSFVVDSAPIEGEAAVVFSPPTGQFLVTFIRDFKTIWGKTVGPTGTLGTATLLKQSTNSAVDGGGFGLPSVAYNSATQTMMLTMGTWSGLACAQQLSASGALIGATDCPSGTSAVATTSVADPNLGRFLLLDNMNYTRIRSTVYQIAP
ncbi:MAG: hypothetical protein IT184_03535, partial [Acidobacteria bacterium]|nr:hypothetical protein [Acidobacteriota bacterium]